MFHRSRDASKVALVHLVARLRAGGFALLDTQFVTDHLKTFGAIEVSRRQYHKLLEAALVGEADFTALRREHDRRGGAAARAAPKPNFAQQALARRRRGRRRQLLRGALLLRALLRRRCCGVRCGARGAARGAAGASATAGCGAPLQSVSQTS